MLDLSNISQKQVEEVVEAIRTKSLEDDNYRRLCFDQPIEAVKQVSNIQVPEGFKLKFVEPSQYDTAENLGVNMVVPLPASGNEERELNEAELEHATGGFGININVPGLLNVNIGK